MANNKVTATGAAGPGLTVTSLVVNNINDVEFDLNAKVLRIKEDSVNHEIDISAATTVTCTITAGTYAFVIS